MCEKPGDKTQAVCGPCRPVAPSKGSCCLHTPLPTPLTDTLRNLASIPLRFSDLQGIFQKLS